MKNRLALALVGVCSPLAAASAMHGQALPTADYKSHLQAGAGVMILDNEYTDRKNKGFTLYGDYDYNHLIGAEVDLHFGGIITPDDIGENTYLIGPRIMYHRHAATVYGKALIGRGTITAQLFGTSSSYNVFAFGGGVEYRVKTHYNIRVLDFEEQSWPAFPPSGLRPIAFTAGVAYAFR